MYTNTDSLVFFILLSGGGSDNVSEKGRRRGKEGRFLQMTVMKNLMKASKCRGSCGKNFSSKFNLKH